MAQDPPPYVPGCDLVEQADGSYLVTHLDSGRVLAADNARHAQIVGTGLAIAWTWKQDAA